ncbi:MAG: hypothetical protein NVS4B7_15750 [Ktedonobacteraceae bacterium]
MYNNESDRTASSAAIQFHMDKSEQQRLEGLPWNVPLDEWPQHGVVPLVIRRGESRHPVIFVEREKVRYAIKETTPRMAQREIANLHEIERRGIPALSPIGSVIVPAPPLLLDEHGPAGIAEYISGDRGYTVTRLAPRVIPQALLYRVPFTRKNKHRLLSAIAILLIELHEHGIYWGDPSLANVLMRIDGRCILAIMADAETTELFAGPVNNRLREQDLESFGESLLWQAEDLRQALELPEEQELVDDKDFRYFEQRYHLLRREHARLSSSPGFTTLFQFQHMLETLNKWGFSVLSMGGHAFQEVATVLPGWYVRRIAELLGITVPGKYARRFYNTILGHQAMLSKNEKRVVSVEEAAKDWYMRYHLPAILLLRQNLSSGQDPMQAYFTIIDLKWKMSLKAGHEISMEEAVLAWAMHQAKTGKLGEVDPATIATWWRERESVAQVLEPPLIESKKLEPLLSKEEQPLVHLAPADMDQELTKILRQQSE